ncbi:MAG: signal recognition particle-docking protein FtsY [Myxococcales bacterium]|nr:signal recognition particle-docking protein FtsY [Myxococcales bacterium]
MPTLLIVLVVLVAAGAFWFMTQGKKELPSGETDAPKLPEPKGAGAAKSDAAPKGEKVEAAPAKAEPARASVKPEARSSVKPPSPTPEAPPVAPSAEATEAAPPSSAPAAEAPAAEAPAAESTPEASAPVREAQPEPAAAQAEVAEVAKAEPEAEPKPRARREKRDLTALKKGLDQTRTGWMSKLLNVFRGKKELDPALLEEIEETLLTGDVGAAATRRLLDSLKQKLDRKDLADTEMVWDVLRDDAHEILAVGAPPFAQPPAEGPLVILMVGVNGAGKTTTIAKMAGRYKEAGRSVLLAAGDTFRAAAVQQLEMWGKRVGVPVHKGKETAKPSSVVFETVQRAVNEKIDVVIADTAGRLQNKAPLMEELRKIRDACNKALPGAPHEILLVLDATTGQNAISQAREFRETLDVTGVVLTKLDGTARGGVILAVADEFKLPVRFIGVGEKSDDLRPFDADDFVDALFARGDDA